MNKRFCLLAVIFILALAGTAVTQTKEETPEKLTVVQTLETARGARTMTLDPKTHKIYLSSVDYAQSSGSPAAGTPSAKFTRPQPLPNSFKVLVYGMDEK